MSQLPNPYYVNGKVVKGFGRGSKQLGIPTANIDSSVVNGVDLKNGIYYGFAQILLNNGSDSNQSERVNGPAEHNNGLEENGALNKSLEWSEMYEMVCSLGQNPHFNNTQRSLEVHILHEFGYDFYGAALRVAICGHIRDEQKFNSLDALIDAIHNDISITKRELSDVKKWNHVIQNQFFCNNNNNNEVP